MTIMRDKAQTHAEDTGMVGSRRCPFIDARGERSVVPKKPMTLQSAPNHGGARTRGQSTMSLLAVHQSHGSPSCRLMFSTDGLKKRLTAEPTGSR